MNDYIDDEIFDERTVVSIESTPRSYWMDGYGWENIRLEDK